MLILDLADDFLDQVLDRDDPVGARIFVDHDGQVRAAAAHIGQHVERAARLRHEHRLAHQPVPVLRCSLAGQRHARDDREHVLDMDHADHRIERFAIDRQPAVAVRGEGVNHLLEAGGGWNRHDFAARDGHVVGIVLAEMEQVLEHLPLDRRKIAVGVRAVAGFGLMLVDRFLKLRAQALVVIVAAKEQALHRAPQRAFTVRVSAAGITSAAALGHGSSHSPESVDASSNHVVNRRHMGRQGPAWQAPWFP